MSQAAAQVNTVQLEAQNLLYFIYHIVKLKFLLEFAHLVCSLSRALYGSIHPR
jgi:hypothetical protein